MNPTQKNRGFGGAGGPPTVRRRPTGSLPRGGSRPARDPAEKARVEALMRRSGISEKDAIRVVRGRATLSEVLEGMFRQQRFQVLVSQGLRADLAGQVVRGRLPLERARKCQELWEFQNAGWKRQQWKLWARGTPVGLFCHGREPFEATLLDVTRYDVEVEGPEGTVRIPKDQVVAYCLAPHREAALAGFSRSPGLEDLGTSRALADRWRPTQSLALEWGRGGRAVRFLLRDGQAVRGVVRRVARYEIELEVQEVRLILMTHAVRKDTPCEVG